MKVVTLCGSMKFKKEMMDIAFDLEIKNGFSVLQCVYNNSNKPLSNDDIQMLADCHYKRIDVSDAIYVVNINGYAGESVKREIAYAKSLGKEIIYHEN